MIHGYYTIFPRPNMKNLFYFFLLFFYFSPAYASCPPGVDPTYCQLAKATGGSVIYCPKGPQQLQCMQEGLESTIPKPPGKIEILWSETTTFLGHYWDLILEGTLCWAICIFYLAGRIKDKKENSLLLLTSIFALTIAFSGLLFLLKAFGGIRHINLADLKTVLFLTPLVVPLLLLSLLAAKVTRMLNQTKPICYGIVIFIILSTILALLTGLSLFVISGIGH